MTASSIRWTAHNREGIGEKGKATPLVIERRRDVSVHIPASDGGSSGIVAHVRGSTSSQWHPDACLRNEVTGPRRMAGHWSCRMVRVLQEVLDNEAAKADSVEGSCRPGKHK